MIPREYQVLLPALVMIASAFFCFVAGRVLKKPPIWGPWSLLALCCAGACLVPISSGEWSGRHSQAAAVQVNSEPPPAGTPDEKNHPAAKRHSDVKWDPFSVVLAWSALVAGFLSVLIGLGTQRTNRNAADFHGMLLLSIAGLTLTGMADDLVALYLALELACLPLCGLLWISRPLPAAREASMKFALMSFVSSALLLLGLCLAYGLAGSTNLDAVRLALLSHETPAEPQLIAEAAPGLGVASMVLIFAGLGFRLAIVPFHFGLKEIFSGVSAEAGTLLAVVPRLAAVAVFLRVLVISMAGLEDTGMLLALVLSGITIVVCGALALRQTRIRSILFYTMMTQGGLVMAALAVAFRDSARVALSPAAGSAIPGGLSAALLVLATDLVAFVGLFALLAYLSRPGSEIEYPEQLSGLQRSQPLAALCAAVLLLSLVGVPPLCGFWARIQLLMAMLSTGGDSVGSLESGPNPGFWILALTAVCGLLATAAVSLQLLIRICLEGQVGRPRPGGGRGALATVVVTAAVSLFFGLWPRPVLDSLETLQAALRTARTVDRNERPSGGAGGGPRRTTLLEGDLNSIATSGTIQHDEPGP